MSGYPAHLIFLVPASIWLFLIVLGMANTAFYRIFDLGYTRKIDFLLSNPMDPNLEMKLRTSFAKANTYFLGNYLCNFESNQLSARIAAETYLKKIGMNCLLARAAKNNHIFGFSNKSSTALFALARVGHPEISVIVRSHLHSTDSNAAHAALQASRIHRSAVMANILLDALDTEIIHASRIATTLEKYSIPLTDFYLDRLQHAHGQSKYWLIYLLGRCKDGARGEAMMTEAITDHDPKIRKIALDSLYRVHSKRCQEMATTLANDPINFVRAYAIRILSSFTGSVTNDQPKYGTPGPNIIAAEHPTQLPSSKAMTNELTTQSFPANRCNDDSSRAIEK